MAGLEFLDPLIGFSRLSLDLQLAPHLLDLHLQLGRRLLFGRNQVGDKFPIQIKYVILEPGESENTVKIDEFCLTTIVSNSK